jgi:hypothetical protein
MAQYCRLKGQQLGATVKDFFARLTSTVTDSPKDISALPTDLLTELVCRLARSLDQGTRHAVAVQASISRHCGDVIPDSPAAKDAPAPRPTARRTASESGSENGAVPFASSLFLDWQLGKALFILGGYFVSLWKVHYFWEDPPQVSGPRVPRA